jgi:CRISPR-associated protein Csd1
MILQRLYEDCDAILLQTTGEVIPPAGYVRKPVRWVIELKAGEKPQLTDLVGLGEGKKAERGRESLMPERKRAGTAIRPFLFADTAAYIFGVDRTEAPQTDAEKKNKTPKRFINAEKPDRRTPDKRRAFVQLAKDCAERTGDSSAAQVVAFLEAWERDDSLLRLDDALDGNQCITFRVLDNNPDGALIADLPSVRTFWAALAAGEGDEGKESEKKKSVDRRCLLTNATGPVEEMMPLPVKGLAGGQPTGTHIVSGNFNAMESYGLTRSENSPISREAGERFGQALNALLASEKHRRRIASATYIFWTTGSPDPLFPPSLEDTLDAETIEKLLDAHRTGKRMFPDADADAMFYVFGLTPNAARAVVRTALAITIRELEAAQAEWFERLKVPAFDDRGQPVKSRPLPIKTLAVAGYREFKDIPASVEDALVRCALQGLQIAPLPLSLLQAVVLRCRAEQAVTYPRAALIKFYLTQEADLEAARLMSEEITTDLPGHLKEKSTAYHLGRLFAELEAIQQQALGNINATIADKFYGSASSTPASVFGILLDGVQNHLAKIRKDRPGAFVGAQKRLEEILAEIPVAGFPKTLPLPEQALFSLGYYHHRAAKRKEISERSAAKREASQLTLDADDLINANEGDNN